MKKKGFITFGNAPKVLLSFGIMVMIAAAVVIALNGFKAGVSVKDLNNGTASTANNTLANGITALSNFSAQLGTVGTMLGVGLLLLIVVGVFAVIGSRNDGL